jgi:hypothetical protein
MQFTYPCDVVLPLCKVVVVFSSATRGIADRVRTLREALPGTTPEHIAKESQKYFNMETSLMIYFCGGIISRLGEDHYPQSPGLIFWSQ